MILTVQLFLTRIRKWDRAIIIHGQGQVCTLCEPIHTKTAPTLIELTMTKQSAKLRAEWDALINKHARPLEKGAKAKGLIIKAQSSKQTVIRRKDTTPSLDSGWASTAAKEAKQYTGSLCIGVAQMHKSNLIPVFTSEAVIDTTKMRR